MNFTNDRAIEGSTNYHVFNTPDNFKSISYSPYNAPTGINSFISKGSTLLNIHHSGSVVTVTYSKNYGKDMYTLIPVFNSGLPPGDVRAYAFIDEQNIVMMAGEISPTQTGYSYQTKIYRINIVSGEGMLISLVDDYYAYSINVTNGRLWTIWSSSNNIYSQFITGYVSHSDDGGITFSAPLLIDAGGSFAIAAGSNSDVFAYSQETAYLSDDGGNTWTKTNFNAGGLMEVQYADEKTIYALGNSNLMKSVDGGFNWSTINKHVEGRLVWGIPKFINASEGIVYSNEYILMTDDGGDTWKLVLSR